MWLQIHVSAGTIYRLEWFDHWASGYSGSVWMTGFETDGITNYFNWTRLIQMTGSAKTFMPSVDGIFKLKCENDSETETIDIGINLSVLDLTNSNHLSIDHEETFLIPVGETYLYDIDVIKDSTYFINLNGSDAIGAMGDETSVTVNAHGELSHVKYFDEQDLGNSWSGINQIEIVAAETEKIYFTLNAAYWFVSRNGSILVTK